jgi:hypothetical protein
MHVENVRSVIEELEREYTILSDKLNEHEKQTDGKDSSSEKSFSILDFCYSDRSNYQ